MRNLWRGAAFSACMIALAGCQDASDLIPKAEKPIPEKLIQAMKAKGMSRTSPIMIRVFKEEAVLEVWKRKDTGRYDLVQSYEICQWSGQLGPKFIEGDRQAPEGFYTINAGLMNPQSSYHLSFNTGFPNKFDRAHGRTGSHLMVHGDCSSSGCYSMTDPQIEEIYAFARDAFRGGQRAFQFQAFPFRMTPENMARYKDDSNINFWRDLKVGYDLFEITKVPPRDNVCGKQYKFAASAPMREDETPDPCTIEDQSPALMATLASYNQTYTSKFNDVLAKGKLAPRSPSIRGLEEARMVADWQRKRNAGQTVPRNPPELDPPLVVKIEKQAVLEAPMVEPTIPNSVIPSEATELAAANAAENVMVANANIGDIPIPQQNPLAAQTDITAQNATIMQESKPKRRLWPFGN